MTKNIGRLLLTLATSVAIASCTGDGGDSTDDGSTQDGFTLTATFDGGETITFNQLDPADSDAGLLTVSCFFEGDHMVIGFGASHYTDSSKSNGFTAGFAVQGITSQRAYAFAEADDDLLNYTSFSTRTAPGVDGLAFYSNEEHMLRVATADPGICTEEPLPVDSQTIDITRYSADDGGTIEGSFDMRVYRRPVDRCAQYELEIITGSFKLKRVNIAFE